MEAFVSVTNLIWSGSLYMMRKAQFHIFTSAGALFTECGGCVADIFKAGGSPHMKDSSVRADIRSRRVEI